MFKHIFRFTYSNQVAPDKNIYPIITLPSYPSDSIPIPMNPTPPAALLHPITAISVDLHHTILVQRFLGVGCIKVLGVHYVPPLSIQAQGRNKTTVKLDFLAQVGGPLLTAVSSSLLQSRQEDHQLKMVRRAFTQGRVEGAPAVQEVVKGEWENEEGTGLLTQMIQVKLQRCLVQGLTFMLFIKHSA